MAVKILSVSVFLIIVCCLVSCNEKDETPCPIVSGTGEGHNGYDTLTYTITGSDVSVTKPSTGLLDRNLYEITVGAIPAEFKGLSRDKIVFKGMTLSFTVNTLLQEDFFGHTEYNFDPNDLTTAGNISSVFAWLVYKEKTFDEIFENDDNELHWLSGTFKKGVVELSNVEQCNGFARATMSCEFMTHSGDTIFGRYDGFINIISDQ